MAELGRLLRKSPEWFLYGEDEFEPGVKDARYEELLARVKLIETKLQKIFEALQLQPPESQ